MYICYELNMCVCVWAYMVLNTELINTKRRHMNQINIQAQPQTV